MKAVVVGMGPNQACWKRGLEVGAQLALMKFNWAEDDPRLRVYAREHAERYAARVAITGRVGERLAAILELHPLHFYRRVERRNLNARWNGKSGKGDVFDRAEGSVAAERLRYADFTHFVLLGVEVARAFGMHNNEWLSVINEFGAPLGDGNQYLIFPHPSGINAWWNEPANVERARVALRSFLGIK